MRTRTVTAGLLLTGLLLTGCSGSSSADAKPEPTKTETITAAAPAPEPAPLTEEETIEQCTNEIADAAPSWGDWSLDLEGWKDNPETPEVCKTLETRDYMGALTDGLDIAAACGTPDALPGKC